MKIKIKRKGVEKGLEDIVNGLDIDKAIKELFSAYGAIGSPIKVIQRLYGNQLVIDMASMLKNYTPANAATILLETSLNEQELKKAQEIIGDSRSILEIELSSKKRVIDLFSKDPIMDLVAVSDIQPKHHLDENPLVKNLIYYAMIDESKEILQLFGIFGNDKKIIEDIILEKPLTLAQMPSMLEKYSHLIFENENQNTRRASIAHVIEHSYEALRKGKSNLPKKHMAQFERYLQSYISPRIDIFDNKKRILSLAYEYFHNRAILSASPNHFHMYLDPFTPQIQEFIWSQVSKLGQNGFIMPFELRSLIGGYKKDLINNLFDENADFAISQLFKLEFNRLKDQYDMVGEFLLDGYAIHERELQRLVDFLVDNPKYKADSGFVKMSLNERLNEMRIDLFANPKSKIREPFQLDNQQRNEEITKSELLKLNGLDELTKSDIQRTPNYFMGSLLEIGIDNIKKMKTFTAEKSNFWPIGKNYGTYSNKNPLCSADAGVLFYEGLFGENPALISAASDFFGVDMSLPRKYLRKFHENNINEKFLYFYNEVKGGNVSALRGMYLTALSINSKLRLDNGDKMIERKYLDMVQDLDGLWIAPSAIHNLEAKVQEVIPSDLFDSELLACCTLYPDGWSRNGVSYLSESKIATVFFSDEYKRSAAFVFRADLDGVETLVVDSIEGSIYFRQIEGWQEYVLGTMKSLAADIGASQIAINKNVLGSTSDKFVDFIKNRNDFRNMTFEYTGNIDFDGIEAIKKNLVGKSIYAYASQIP